MLPAGARTVAAAHAHLGRAGDCPGGGAAGKIPELGEQRTGRARQRVGQAQAAACRADGSAGGVSAGHCARRAGEHGPRKRAAGRAGAGHLPCQQRRAVSG